LRGAGGDYRDVVENTGLGFATPIDDRTWLLMAPCRALYDEET
jgi:hypothetical protein